MVFFSSFSHRRFDGNVHTPSATPLPLVSCILTEECSSSALMEHPVLVWTYGHSLEETFGMVERSWFLGLDLCLGHTAPFLRAIREVL